MKKARKSKFVIGGVALLSCVALAGVGYSSWVITSTVTSQTGNVSVTASAVEDDRITIDTVDVTDASYSFGPSTESAGLISASNGSEESLSVSFSFDVTYASTLNKTYNITLALASNVTCGDGTSETTLGAIDNPASTASGHVDALAYATSTAVSYTHYTSGSVSGTYLDAPASGLVGTTGITIATVSSSGVSASTYSSKVTNGTGSLQVSVSGEETYTKTVTVTAAFGWGTYFGGTNPVNLTESEKLDDYVDGLNWLYSAFGSAKFTYTIGGSVQASTQTESTETNSD